MKNIVKLLVVVLTIVLIAIPVSAATLPDEGAQMGSGDNLYYYLTADAKADLPSNFASVYGIKFDVTLDANSIDKTFTQMAIYWTAIYVDNGSEAATATMHIANTGVNAIFTSIGAPLSPMTAVEIEAGASGNMKYLAAAPLFTAGASMAKVRLAMGDGAKKLGMKYTLTNIKWLDSAGNVLSAQTSGENPTTGDNDVYLYIVGALAAAVVMILVLKRKCVKAN